MRWLLAIAALATSTTQAAEYMREIKREPFAAPGTSQELARRAAACIAKATRIDASPFIDAEAGIVVATTKIDGRKFFTGQQQIIRSQVTIETRDGRFRITHSDVTVGYITSYGKAEPGFKPVEAGSKAATDVAAALSDSDQQISNCIATAANDF